MVKMTRLPFDGKDDRSKAERDRICGFVNARYERELFLQGVSFISNSYYYNAIERNLNSEVQSLIRGRKVYTFEGLVDQSLWGALFC